MGDPTRSTQAPPAVATTPDESARFARLTAVLVLCAPLAWAWRVAVAAGTPVSAPTFALVGIVALGWYAARPHHRAGIAMLLWLSLWWSAGFADGTAFTWYTLVWGATLARAFDLVPLPRRVRPDALGPSIALGLAACAAAVARPNDRVLPAVLFGAAGGAAAAIVLSARAERLAVVFTGRFTDVTPAVRRRWWAAWQRGTDIVRSGWQRWRSGRAAPGGGWVASRDTRRPGIWFPAVSWCLAACTVTAFRLVAPVPGDPTSRWFTWTTVRRNFSHDVLVGGWMRWDAVQYLRIAEDGYQYTPGSYFLPHGDQSPVAWFPGWGLAIRTVSVVLGDHATSAFVLSLACGLGATILLWVWMADRAVAVPHRRAAVVLWLLYPYNFMSYGAGYSESFVALLVVGAFLTLGRGRVIVPGTLAALALLARPNVIAFPLAVGAAAIGSWARGRRRTGSDDRAADLRTLLTDRRWRVAAISLSSLVAFVSWCWWTYGEPLLYWNARRQVYPLVDLTDVDGLLRIGLPVMWVRWFRLDAFGAANLVTCALVTVAVIWTLPTVRRRFGDVAGWFVGTSVAIVWISSDDFVAAGRYLAVAFPALVAWAGWFESRPRLLVATCVAWAAASLWLVYQYTHLVDLGW